VLKFKEIIPAPKGKRNFAAPKPTFKHSTTRNMNNKKACMKEQMQNTNIRDS